ncbi:MAG: NAD(P)H-dependent oxidoreductase [Actinobacteria bacterium]|nr:NAD(P)H-dependent oxidoreductase [Actinomycetota bacterium]
MGPAEVRIAAFGGSLRAGSLNGVLLDHAVRIAEPLCEISRLEIRDLPLYNQDLDPTMGDGDTPAAVAAFRNAIDAADGVMIVSPEYSWSVPGPTKNAIDWVSRPAFDTPLTGKPVLLAGASPGPAGTGRAQLHLRQILHSLRALALVNDLQVPFAHSTITPDGGLDPQLELRIGELLRELVDDARAASAADLVGRYRVPPATA